MLGVVPQWTALDLSVSVSLCAKPWGGLWLELSREFSLCEAH